MLDSTYDPLHEAGKIEYATGEVFIAYLAFVVTKTDEEGRVKDRVVIDIRPLNRLVLPDMYPLPD